VNWTTSNNASALGFVLNGANTSSPFDGVNYQQSSGSAVSITTTNANDFLFAWVDNAIAATDSGFTTLGNTGYVSGEYQTLNATNSFSLDFVSSPTGQHFGAVGIKSQ
jgi:hypothetical protein